MPMFFLLSFSGIIIFFLSGSNEWRREWFSSVFLGYRTAHSHSTVSVKLLGRSMALVLDHDVPF